jgi:hypothetical protein
MTAFKMQACMHAHAGWNASRSPYGTPPGRPAPPKCARAGLNLSGPVPECVNINKRITSADSIEACFPFRLLPTGRPLRTKTAPYIHSGLLL